MTPVKYVGTRPYYVEGCYGSKINFTKGETILVPDDLALKLFRHADVYAPGHEEKNTPTAIIKVTDLKELETEADLQHARDVINTMDSVDSLAEYAMTNFSQKLDKRQSIPTLRTKVIHLIDLYGVT
jgi:hypothetical protein